MSDIPAHEPAQTRRKYTLTAEHSAQLLSVKANGTSDGLNQFWAERGAEMGFKWTTVEDGRIPMIDPPQLEFTAEPEVAVDAGAIDGDAMEWIDRTYPSDPKDPDDAPDRQTFGRDALAIAFNAGRDHGFTMGSAAPQPDSRGYEAAWNRMFGYLSWMQDDATALKEAAGFMTWGRDLADVATQMIVNAYPQLAAVAKRDPSPGWVGDRSRLMMAATRLLGECAERFREYEKIHRDRMANALTDEDAHASYTKAARNAAMADRIDELLWSGVKPSGDIAGQPAYVVVDDNGHVVGIQVGGGERSAFTVKADAFRVSGPEMQERIDIQGIADALGVIGGKPVGHAFKIEGGTIHMESVAVGSLSSTTVDIIHDRTADADTITELREALVTALDRLQTWAEAGPEGFTPDEQAEFDQLHAIAHPDAEASDPDAVIRTVEAAAALGLVPGLDEQTVADLRQTANRDDDPA